MAIKLVSFKCPECGADLNIEANRETAYCTYCGTKILIHNENEYIFRKIDEAELKRAENEVELQKNQLKYDQNKRIIDLLADRSHPFLLGIFLGFIGLFLIIIGAVLYEYLHDKAIIGFVLIATGGIIGLFALSLISNKSLF